MRHFSYNELMKTKVQLYKHVQRPDKRTYDSETHNTYRAQK